MKTDPAEAARAIKVFFCDSDGVMFANTAFVDEPSRTKHRSYYDGQGVSLLRAIGIRVVFITNERGESATSIRQTVEKLNSLPSSKPQTADGWEPIVLYEGRGGVKKLDTAKEFLDQNGLTFADAAYMGDDLVDVPLLKAVALPAAPAQAEEAVKKICAFVSKREGGAGAVRDFANMVLEARDVDPFTLPPQ